MNDRSARLVKCPFFRMPKEGRKNTIRCEGVDEIEVTELIFSHTDKKKRWLKKYCNTFSFLRCPYAKLLDDTWKEKLNGEQEKTEI